MLTGSTHFHYSPLNMADPDKMDVLELPEDPAPAANKSSDASVEAAIDEVDIARIEKVYKYDYLCQMEELC